MLWEWSHFGLHFGIFGNYDDDSGTYFMSNLISFDDIISDVEFIYIILYIHIYI